MPEDKYQDTLSPRQAAYALRLGTPAVFGMAVLATLNRIPYAEIYVKHFFRKTTGTQNHGDGPCGFTRDLSGAKDRFRARLCEAAGA